MPEQNEPLSERELDILRLVATGAANKEIARQLVISPNTVKVHLRNVFAKIGVSSRTEATLYAVQIGLVNPTAARAAEESSGADESIQGEAAVLPEAGLPGIVIEDQQEGSAVSQAPVATAGRPWKAWQLALALLLAVVLIGSGVAMGARLMSAPIPFPTVAANSTTQTSTTGGATQASSGPGIGVISAPRWAEKPLLPEARKGMGVVEYENAYFLIGGETSRAIDGAVLRFNAAENAWKALASKPTPVTDIQAVLLGEKIYVPGGRMADGKSTGSLEVYDPRADTWERKAALPNPVSAYALAAFEGRLYLFGGKNGEEYLDMVYVYSPQEDRWAQGTPMSLPRAFAGAAVVGGKIHVIGGHDGEHALDLNQVYFPPRDGSGEDPWEDSLPLPAGRYAMGVTSLTSSVYLLGGLNESGEAAEPSGLQYSAQSGQWNTFDAPPAAVGAQPALLASGNYLWALGGETQQGLSAMNLAYQAIYTVTVPLLRNDESSE